METFFTRVAKTKRVLFLATLVTGAVVLLWQLTSMVIRHTRSGADLTATNAQTEAKNHLQFGGLEDITGADTQMVTLHLQQSAGSSFSGKGYGGQTRNVLFLTGADKAVRWLFKDAGQLVLVASQLSDTETPDPKKAVALYFEVVANDTDKDSKLTTDDLLTIVLTRPNGAGMTEVLHGVSRVLSYKMLGSRFLSIVYQEQNALKHAKIDVNHLTITSNQTLVEAPTAR